MRRLGAAVGVAVLLCAAGLVSALEPWQGPVILSLSAGHGVHEGDLPAIPLVVAAIALWRWSAAPVADRPRRSWSWAFPASAVVLGVALLVVGFNASASGGALVPAAGGTFGGTITEPAAKRPVPVGRWSDVAATYDGAEIRLYVNGKEVASEATKGPIQVTHKPVWIGGNVPYGEHFAGRIDEVRVYSRALRPSELRADMATPVKPAPGLVAAYGFDAGSGRTAADSSGQDNTGEINGATWTTKGRYGDALSFDGASSVVSVPPSRSLNLTHAMTLSAWVRPSGRQSGWRTIVQHETDAYMVTASSERQNEFGVEDDLRALIVVGALAWFCVGVATRPRRPGERVGSWWVPVGLFLAGSLADAALAPSGSMIGALLAAAWLAATAKGLERVVFVLATIAFAIVTAAAIGGWTGPREALLRDDGAVVRTMAIGSLFLAAGALRFARRRERNVMRAT